MFLHNSSSVCPVLKLCTAIAFALMIYSLLFTCDCVQTEGFQFGSQNFLGMQQIYVCVSCMWLFFFRQFLGLCRSCSLKTREKPQIYLICLTEYHPGTIVLRPEAKSGLCLTEASLEKAMHSKDQEMKVLPETYCQFCDSVLPVGGGEVCF